MNVAQRQPEGNSIGPLSASRAPQERLGIMLVGIDGIGKRDLGDSIVEASKARDVELDVFTFSGLPLKEAFERRVDHIVFMVDMTSKLSLQRVAESVAYVDCDFSLARASVVVINSDTPARFSFAIDEVLDFCDLYGTFIHYCTLEDADSLSATGAALVQASEQVRRPRGLSPMFSTLLF